MGRVEERRVVATQAFTQYRPEDGYLVFQPGENIVVQYEGCQTDEVGWLYGYKPDTLVRGWFLASHVVEEQRCLRENGLGHRAATNGSLAMAAAPPSTSLKGGELPAVREQGLARQGATNGSPHPAALCREALAADAAAGQRHERQELTNGSSTTAGRALPTFHRDEMLAVQAAMGELSSTHGCGVRAVRLQQSAPGAPAQNAPPRGASSAARALQGAQRMPAQEEQGAAPRLAEVLPPPMSTAEAWLLGSGEEPGGRGGTQPGLVMPPPPQARRLEARNLLPPPVPQPVKGAAPAAPSAAAGEPLAAPPPSSQLRAASQQLAEQQAAQLRQEQQRQQQRQQQQQQHQQVRSPHQQQQALSAPPEYAGVATNTQANGLCCSALPPPGFERPVRRSSALGEAQAGLQAGGGLPMATRCSELAEMVTKHRLVVIDAATGSGKSTLVPLVLAKQCFELGRDCRIVVTQPRRLAARGLAKRVSEQCRTWVGDLVGYRVGSDKKDKHAAVVYVTAGHLLEALVHNPAHLRSFSHVVLDEVHERSVEAEFLMALLRLQLSTPETIATRIVMMSATLQRELSRFFRPLLLPSPADLPPGVLSLPGSTPYPVVDCTWEDLQARWPGVVNAKSLPSFLEIGPKKGLQLPWRRRSDQNTKLVKELAPYCARLLVELRDERPNETCVSLVFLPGLDSMREVEEAVDKACGYARKTWPKKFLMHSTLDQETYEGALDPPQEGEWRIVLATTIAESSLTVPGVNAVVDFGFHRVNVYDDDARMSMLATEWCSKASCMQRRGRTGRTNPGFYIQLFPTSIKEEMADFDASGVQRSPLTRVTLEAAHLAQLLSDPPRVRAGAPVDIAGLGPGVALFWDEGGRGWRVEEENGMARLAPESALMPLCVDARQMLGLLPTPPTEDRVVAALLELQELGALCAGDTPSVMGTACLKLPTDVPLARLVLLGWALGMAVDAVLLAAALSLAPHCDVFKTPFNTSCELARGEVQLLKNVVEERRRADSFNNGAEKPFCSEPLTIHTLCQECLTTGRFWPGRAPRIAWSNIVNVKAWTQLTDKIVELTEGLLRLLPADGSSSEGLQRLLSRVRGGASDPPKFSSKERLQALLTWALAPQGFVSIGQSAALYGGEAYRAFARVVKSQDGQMERSLWWPRVSDAQAKEVSHSLFPGVLRWAVTFHGETFLDTGKGENFELLCRICGPYNGKQTSIAVGQGARYVSVRPPRHPCMLNWYMPRRDGRGLLEVRVSWKSPAETILQVPQRGRRDAACRAKRFLVASGGEYQCSRDEGLGSVGFRRSIMLRGATSLPWEDGGRASLLWLLAAGLPREERMVALVAPCGEVPAGSGEFEIRAVRLWQRTLCLPRSAPISSMDLEAVNAFRCALLELQRRKPHRLAGTWRSETSEARHIECMDACHLKTRGLWLGPGDGDVLVVAGGPQALLLYGTSSRVCWQVHVLDKGRAGTCRDPVAQVTEESDGILLWADGSRWLRSSGVGEQAPVLGALREETVAAFRQAAQELYDRYASPDARRSSRTYWPARLVPLKPVPHSDGKNLKPFDLNLIEECMVRFSSQLADSDRESDEGDGRDDASSADDEDDEDPLADASQEAVNEEWMWKLADQPNFSVAESRQLCFVESSIALPTMPFCVECEEEGKTFSKSQLARHPDERRCKDCVAKSANAVYRPANMEPTLAAGLAQPGAAAASGAAPQQSIPLCSICRIPLTKANCSASQRQKTPGRRRCVTCVTLPGA